MTVKNGEDKSIGAILYELRKKSGLSRVELADLAGVGKTAVFDVEHGKQSVRFDTIMKLAGTLNVTVSLRSPFGEEWRIHG